MRHGQRGQVLVAVIVIMMILAIIVPAMVLYVQNEAKWSLKQQRNMTAFQLAEGGVDKGFRKISESTTTWDNGQNGVFPAGYRFDQTYTDLTGGCYTLSITSGPDSGQVTIISISSDASKHESRAIQAVYANAPLGDTAVRSQSGVTVDGSQTMVEWGAIVTPKNVDVNGRNSPQIWTSGSVDLDANGSTPPNCDSPGCVQWHSYDSDIPPDPGIDATWYYNNAVASGTYYNGNQCWGKNSGTACGVSCNLTCSNSTACLTGKPYYINGDLCVEGKIYVNGSLFVTGNMTMPNGLAGDATRTIPLPRKAWMQYGNNWAYYTGKGWDSTAPASFPGLNSTYKSPATDTVTLDKVMVEGFLYVGGNLTQTGGAGQEKVLGAMFVAGTVTVSPNNLWIYYLEGAGDKLKTTSIILSRLSWKDVPERKWPSGLSCNL